MRFIPRDFSLTNIFLGMGMGIALVCGVLFYEQHKKPETLTHILSSDCDLKTGFCRIQISDNESINMHLQITRLPTLSPVIVDVQFENIKPLFTAIEFISTDINMGENRPHLVLQPDGQRYQTRTLLPTNQYPEMHWKILLSFSTLNQPYQAQFKLTTLNKKS